MTEYPLEMRQGRLEQLHARSDLLWRSLSAGELPSVTALAVHTGFVRGFLEELADQDTAAGTHAGVLLKDVERLDDKLNGSDTGRSELQDADFPNHVQRQSAEVLAHAAGFCHDQLAGGVEA